MISRARLAPRFGASAVMALLVAILNAACVRFGDPIQAKMARVVNATGNTIMYYSKNRDSFDSYPVLGPNESKLDAFLVSTDPEFLNRQQFRVEAEDDTGEFIFCRVYTRLELEDFKWEITILRGAIGCARTMPSPSPMPSPTLKGGDA